VLAAAMACTSSGSDDDDDAGTGTGTADGSSSGSPIDSGDDTPGTTAALDGSTGPEPTSSSSSSSPVSSSESSGETGSSEESTASGPAQVVFETTLGTIVIELDETAAPITATNFIAYVESGFYDGSDGLGATVFHRVIPGFVVQGGGLTEELDTKATMPPIVNEFGNGLLNVRGAISMARTMNPDSATSQFFINLVDNTGLDVPPGYAVFGEVVEGMDVVDAMALVDTATMGPYEDVPVVPIIVTSATVQ
jgi:peptidyl-prolyl cis-trans isomerase A (cyclophilin A)